MVKQLYLKQDEITFTHDYNDAGVFDLVQATKLVIRNIYTFISPDSSGRWLVVQINGTGE